MTAAMLAILLCSVQVFQVSLNPGVTGIGTDLVAFLCDEHDGRQHAAGAGAVITQDAPVWELVGCVGEAADWDIGSNCKRQGELM